MARNGKAINVKIATAKVIKALENALAKLEKDYSTQEANEAKHEKAMEKWRKDLFTFALTKTSKAENIRANYRSYNKTLNIDFDILCDSKDVPTMPERDFEQISVYDYRQQKEEISNAIRILKMTDEEVISTSTYNSVAKYL